MRWPFALGVPNPACTETYGACSPPCRHAIDVHDVAGIASSAVKTFVSSFNPPASALAGGLKLDTKVFTAELAIPATSCTSIACLQGGEHAPYVSVHAGFGTPSANGQRMLHEIGRASGRERE